MDRKRVITEIMTLRRKYPVQYDLEKALVMLVEVDFPKGWSPKRGAILYKLPKIYPKSYPAVYVPSKMRYRGSVPEHMTVGLNAFSKGESWAKWCIRDLDWEPGRHTLITITRAMMTSLSQPNKDRVV